MGDTSPKQVAEDLCRALGYQGCSTYYDAPETFDRRENVHVVLTAFDVIGVHSVFGLSDGALPDSFKPVVYLGIAHDDKAGDELHRRVWTQGVAPILILVTPNGVELRNAFGPPVPDDAKVRFVDFSTGLPECLENVSARALTTSIFWRDRDVTRENAVDSRLVTAIEKLNDHACEAYPKLDTRAGRALVNALVGRLIYLYVLIDRGLVSEEWLRAAIAAAGCDNDGFASAAVHRGVRADHPEFSSNEVWASLDAIDAAINGCVFPIPVSDRLLIPSRLMNLVHGVVRWGETVGGRQLSFLDVSFQVLRTETISAIYERFLRVEDGDAQRAEGAFYTPPYLADFVVSQADALQPFDSASLVIDAAAGSGVFLVSAYRRIMERCAPPGGWGARHVNAARHLLTGCIFGIEKNPQAANVCRFSLYLTMLDYAQGVEIGSLTEVERGGKLLPPLDGNIVVASAFAVPHGERRFTHVLGNPPWLRLKRRGSRRNVPPTPTTGATAAATVKDAALDAFLSALDCKTPVMHGRLSDAFVWLASERLAAQDAVIGLILPTTSLVGRQSERFATALASRLSVKAVANLSYLRYKLFTGARAPASIVVARRRPSQPSDPVTIYRPRLSSLPLGGVGDVWALMVSQTDLHTVHGRDLQGDANGWFGPLILGTLDRRTRDALRNLTHRREWTVAGFLERSGLRIARGGNEDDSGFRFPMRANKRGRMVPVNLVAIPGGPGPEVKEGYRDLFSGNVLLVPRSFKGLRFLEGAHAFNSTYYAVAFGKPETAEPAFDRSAAPAKRAAGDALRNLKTFLDSGAVQYFAALYGATVLLDGARFEKGDLLALPCPFRDVDDPAFMALRRSSDIDGAILGALGAGADLRRAVKEFREFSEGYADAQLPEDAFDEAEDEQIDTYMERLRRELAGSFSGRFAPVVRLAERGGGLVSLHVSFGRDLAGETSRPFDRDGTFIASSVISFDAEAGDARVRKSAARFAWMSDQAVEDAGELLRQVVSGRA